MDSYIVYTTLKSFRIVVHYDVQYYLLYSLIAGYMPTFLISSLTCHLERIRDSTNRIKKSHRTQDNRPGGTSQKESRKALGYRENFQKEGLQNLTTPIITNEN